MPPVRKLLAVFFPQPLLPVLPVVGKCRQWADELKDTK